MKNLISSARIFGLLWVTLVVGASPAFAGWVEPLAVDDFGNRFVAERRGPPPSPEQWELKDELGQAAEETDDNEEPPTDDALVWVVKTVLSWHVVLGQYVPPALAWAILAAPLWLPIGWVLLLRAWRGRRGRGRRGASRGGQAEQEASAQRDVVTESKVAEVPPLELTPAQQLLFAPERGGASLHETLVVLGSDQLAFAVLRRLLASAFDADTWSAMVNLGQPERLRALRLRWIKDVATERVARWLARHPLIGRSGLEVQVPREPEVAELENLTLTRPDGLAAPLDADQHELIQRAREALALAYADNGDPYALVAAALRLRTAELLGDSTDDDQTPAPPLSLALLLHGVPALNHSVGTGLLAADLGRELCTALEEHHRIADRQVPAEGCAVHCLYALGSASAAGIGTLLASVAGAAFSTSSVVLRLSKLAAEVPSDRQLALGRLGEKVAALLATPQKGDGAVLVANLRRLLGGDLMRRHAARFDELAQLVGRSAARKPPWGKEGKSAAAPDTELVQLHHALLSRREAHSEAALHHLWSILTQLAYAGKRDTNKDIAHRRLGYTVAGFGGELFRGTGVDLLSIVREVSV